MNILVTINKEYVKQLNILLNSIQYSNMNENFDIYILHKNLSKEDMREIKKNLDLKRFFIHDTKIPKSEINNFPVYEKRYPAEIYFRIFATKYLPEEIDRVLYLDADTIVINDLKQLYTTNFENNYFIATTHIKKMLHKFNELRLDIKKDEPYINTGVLLINLKELRKTNVEQKVLKYVNENKKKLILPDQDIICSIYGNKIKLIDDLKYNLGDKNLRKYNLENPNNKLSLKWVRRNTVIIHYYGRNKPWNKDYKGTLGCFYKKIEKKINKKDYKDKKVLILSCGTGGGHNSAAKAIQEELLNKGIQADFFEYLDIINPKLSNKINMLYLKSTKGKAKIFKSAYHLGEIYQKTKLKSPVYALNSLTNKTLYKFIQDNKYDYIVTTHLFAAQALTKIKKEHKIKFLEIATDYVCIPFWQETNPDYIVIPHKDLEHEFLEKGFKKEKILSIGIPTSIHYTKKYSKDECKKELKLDENKEYILILTGSMGFGNVLEMVEKLLKEINNINFIVSCGSNKNLIEFLKKKYRDNYRIVILSYTNILYKYVASSEIVLTKPGSLTTTELATIRKPFIHTNPIPGCENHNADFFANRKMTIKCDNINEIINSTKLLLNDKKLQNEMTSNQEKYINANACEDICNIIIKELKE